MHAHSDAVPHASPGSGGVIETFAGGSSKKYSGVGGPASAAGFYSVNRLRYDGAGHLFIVDADAGVVRQVDLNSDIITTVAGNGYWGYLGDGENATEASLNGPWAIAATASGNLCIADTGNDRIRGIVQPLAQLTGQLTASSTSFAGGTSVTVTLSYSGALAGIAPTGAVPFLDGTASIGTGALTAGASAGTYVATFESSTLAAGTHSISAQYAGDGSYAAVTTPAVVLPVTAPIPASYTVAANPSSLTMSQGSSGSAVLTITPQGGFEQAVTLSC